MKKKLVLWFTLFCVLLPGCSGADAPLGPAMEFRSRLLSAEGCSFDAQITADFRDRLYTFEMNCRMDGAGNVNFTVTAPETIAGISGSISREGGNLTFDDTALAFDLMADGRFSPVSAPWILVHTLRSGYIVSCAEWENGIIVNINDSYEDNALNLSVWLGKEGFPTGAEISWQGRRLLSMNVKNFSLQ